MLCEQVDGTEAMAAGKELQRIHFLVRSRACGNTFLYMLSTALSITLLAGTKAVHVNESLAEKQ